MSEQQKYDDPLTPQLVRDFWKFMTETYDTRVIDKASATSMRLVARLFEKLHLADPEEFLRRATATVGSRIYVPFAIGTPSEHFDLWEQVKVCVSDHRHIELIRRDGWLTFARRHLLSSYARIGYELEALRAELELEYWRYGALPDLLRLAARTRYFGLTETEVVVVAHLLQLAAESVKQGTIASQAALRAIAWLDDYAQQLKTS